MASLARLSFGMVAIMLTIVGCQSAPELKAVFPQSREASHGHAFSTGEIINMFESLHTRQCAPSDFDWNNEKHQDLKDIFAICKNKATGGKLGDQCADVEELSLYFVCIANSLNELDVAGASFNLTAFQLRSDSYSNDPQFSLNEQDMFHKCIREADADLTPRQQAVYTYACLKWCFAVVCDQTQNAENRLDDEGKNREVIFLNGLCSLSPAKLLDPFQLVTGRTWAECSQSVASASNNYDAAIGRVSCMLQDFQTASGKMNFDSLKTAINGASGGTGLGTTYMLNQLVTVCGSASSDVTSQEFVRCWAGWGLYSCSYEEANHLAQHFPQSCTVTA